LNIGFVSLLVCRGVLATNKVLSQEIEGMPSLISVLTKTPGGFCMALSYPEQSRKHTQQPRWSVIVITLHWLSFVVVVAAITAIFAADAADKPSSKALWMSFHYLFGIATFLLFGARIAARCLLQPRQSELGEWVEWSDWTDWAAQGTHTVLYALLFVLPMLGWALVNAQGRDVSLLTLKLPRLIGERNLDLAYTLQNLHSSAAWTLIVLVWVHAIFVFWQQFTRRDGILCAMLPMFLGRKRDSGYDSPPQAEPSPPPTGEKKR